MRRLQGVRGYTLEIDRQEWLPVVSDFAIHDDWSALDPAVPLMVYGNLRAKPIVDWIEQHRPLICMNRPHIAGWSGQYDLEARRFAINGFACTKWGQRTHDRFPLLRIPRHAWKVKKIRRVLIAPPGKLLWFWRGVKAQDWADQQARFFADKKVEVRFRWKYENRKGKGGRYVDLWQDFDWADLVVSWASAITAEAFWYGKKAISLAPCPTWVCCDRDLNNWDDPREPEQRDEWHEHMAWTQFTRAEMQNGAGAAMILQYQGWPINGQ